MKGKLIISSFDEEYDMFYTNVLRGIDPFDYEIEIKTSLEGNFEDLISKPYDFEESINLSLDIIAEDPKHIELLKNIRDNRLQYIKNIDDIVFKYKPNEIAEFIKRNPILKTKRIIFEVHRELNSKLINEVSEAFGKNTSNIYFDIAENEGLTTFKEYKDTIDAINNMINDIEKFNFSPLEKIMYTYDIVRNKIYVEVDADEDKSISRNLSSALLGDKIVCLGYAKIFKTLLEKLGIECNIVILKDFKKKKKRKKKGHARNAIYIKDEKYGVNGVYYFDPTWDNKKNNFDNEFLFSYKYFALTKKKMDKIDGGHIIDSAFPYFTSNIALELEKQIDEVGFEGLSDELIKSINQMSYLTKGETVINKRFQLTFAPQIFKHDKEKVIKKVTELIKYFDSTISADTLLRVLYNVRKQQYYNNPEKYPFGLIEFCKTVFISGWNFDGAPLENLALEFATSAKEKGKIKVSQTIRYAKETNMLKNIQQVKLAKTLRRVYEQKNKK